MTIKFCRINQSFSDNRLHSTLLCLDKFKALRVAVSHWVILGIGIVGFFSDAMSLFFLLGTLHHCLFHDGLDALLFARSSHVTLGTVVLEPKLIALVLKSWGIVVGRIMT